MGQAQPGQWKCQIAMKTHGMIAILNWRDTKGSICCL